MKFSIVRTDRKGAQHLSVKTTDWFFDRIRHDTKACDIARLRDHVAVFHDLKGYESMHPVAKVFPSVEFSRQENGNLEVVAFNSVISLHATGMIRPDDIERVKNASMVLPTTLAAFAGADGRSVEILVKVERKGGMTDRTEEEMDRFCAAAYELAIGIYGAVLPVPIERQKATARSWFYMTLDEQPLYNLSPTPLTIEGERQTVTPAAKIVEEQRDTDFALYAIYEQQYGRAAEETALAVSEISEDQRAGAYATELARRLCKAGMPQEEAFLHMRNHHLHEKGYDELMLRSVLQSVYSEVKTKNNPQTLLTGDGANTRRLIDFLNTRYVFRYNTVMGYTEYRPNNTWTQDWQPCDDSVINGMTIKAKLAGLDVLDKDVRRYVRSDMIRECDPIEDYMMSVSGKWDGKTDHIGLLARCVHCDLPQWERWFRKWFLSMVAQWILPRQEYGNSVVPMLISPQGDGKTTFCRMILPKALRWGFLENLDVSEKRQTLQAMHSFLLINLDEFNQIGPNLQEGFLKNVIQLPSVKLKRPYGKHVEEFKRYASFIATTNETNVLSDPTGNRRFICAQMTAPVDMGYQPNYEGLYGQAFTLIMERREQWWFTPEEVAAVKAHNRRFEMKPAAIQYFLEYFEPAEDEADGEWLSPTAIYTYLRKMAGSGLQANGVSNFGRFLNNLPGLNQKRDNTGKLYLVRRVRK